MATFASTRATTLTDCTGYSGTQLVPRQTKMKPRITYQQTASVWKETTLETAAKS